MAVRVPGLPGDKVVCYSNKISDTSPSVVTINRYAEIHRGPTGRSEQKNGVFRTASYVHVQGPDQVEHLVTITDLTPLPGAKWKSMEEERLRDLPTPKFWEDDIVETADGRIAKVGVVKYGLLDDEEFPPFMLLKGDDLVVDKNGVPQEFFSADLKLVERGNIFHFFNGNSCTFNSVEEEAHFHYRLGLVEHVSNPISGHFGFSHHQAIAALETGKIDMIFVDACHSIDGIHTCFCYRINDRELADRARKTNLAGLELAQTVGMRR